MAPESLFHLIVLVPSTSIVVVRSDSRSNTELETAKKLRYFGSVGTIDALYFGNFEDSR